jgi:hypothetical protein
VYQIICAESHKIASFEAMQIYSCANSRRHAFSRVRFFIWFCEAVYSGEINPLFTCVTDEMGFLLEQPDKPE